MGNQQSGVVNGNSDSNHDASSDGQRDETAQSTSTSQQTNQGSQANKAAAATTTKMIRGPKAMLSSSIATALSEYFEVDASAIESNLINDANITLRNVKLRQQITTIPLNSAGCTTTITTNGTIEEVTFRWAWHMGGDVSGQWIKDAVLMIGKTKFHAQLEHVKLSKSPLRESEKVCASPSTVDTDSAWGLSGFVSRQIKMVIDMLTLRMVDFELRIELPSGLPDGSIDRSEDGEVDHVSDAETKKKRLLLIGAKEIELLSHGRDDDKQDSTALADELKKLKQTIHFRSFALNVKIEGGGDTNDIPLMEPFSYSADMERVGERFGGFMTGLEFLGISHNESSEGAGSNLAWHMGNVQIETLNQLGVMMLAPPDTGTTVSPQYKPNERENVEAISSGGPLMTNSTEDKQQSSCLKLSEQMSSSFVLPLSSASLILFDETKFFINDIKMRYKADGTVFIIEISKMGFDSITRGHAEASKIEINMRPKTQIRFSAIDSLHIPDAILLSKPVENVELTYERKTLSARLDAVDVIILNKEETLSETKNSTTSPHPKPSTTSLPCAIDFEMDYVKIKKAADGSINTFTNLHLYGLPNDMKNSTNVAIRFGSFKNNLVEMTQVNMCASIPNGAYDCINGFNFSMERATIVSGHTAEEWTEAFRPKRKEVAVKQSAKEGGGSSVIKMPYANIADIKVMITYRVTVGVKMNQTPLTIKAFRGSAEATSKEVMNYYVKACLSRFPDFLSNAEVLGLNL